MSSEVSRSYRYIVRSPDVRGGHARVEGTRIAVHDVIGLLQNGAQKIAKGEKLAFNYRVLLHRGDTRRGDVSGKWTDYAFPPAVKPAE